MGDGYAATLADVFFGAGLVGSPRLRIPREIERYRRPKESPFFLTDFLKRYSNTPPDEDEVLRLSLRDKLALLKHDRCLEAVASRPNRQAPRTYVPPDAAVFKEVRLDLEHSDTPLTAVDILAYDGRRCYLWGVVSYGNRKTVDRDTRSVTEACKYLFYNFAVDSTLFLADGSNIGLECDVAKIESRLVPAPRLDSHYRGILRAGK